MFKCEFCENPDTFWECCMISRLEKIDELACLVVCTNEYTTAKQMFEIMTKIKELCK